MDSFGIINKSGCYKKNKNGITKMDSLGINKGGKGHMKQWSAQTDRIKVII